jgi:type IV pilus assembly protein PilB
VEFLREIAPKLVKNKDDLKKINKLDSDKKVFSFLLEKEVGIEKIKKEFKDYYGYDFVDILNQKIKIALLNKFDKDSLRKIGVIPIGEDKENKTFHFAIGNIANGKIKNTVDNFVKSIGYRADYSFAILAHVEKIYDELEKNKENKVEEREGTDDFNPRKWVDDIINKGISLKASDIHIEQFENIMKVRYRVDGDLRTFKESSFTDAQISSINVRTKMISDLDISEKRKPQDGRIDDYEYKGVKYDIRVSSVSTINGEKFTLRIFEKSSETLDFEALGFSKENEKIAKRILSNKNGIVYLGGATGSGKTTTLYTMVDHKNTDKVNIYTIENPVEKTIEEINQIQINELAGITYPSILRALLRQDPDIIVVGETRDVETMELAVRASLTGHLVLTTIHANNAIDSISRVMDMGIEPYLISASSIGFISQRLVKKLCPYCKRKIEKLQPFQEKWLEENEEKYNVKIDRNNIFEAKGCSKCNEGYSGRVAMSEILEIDEKRRSLISSGMSITDFRKEVLKDGFKPFVIDGINKISQGTTTIEEVMKEI